MPVPTVRWDSSFPACLRRSRTRARRRMLRCGVSSRRAARPRRGSQVHLELGHVDPGAHVTAGCGEELGLGVPDEVAGTRYAGRLAEGHGVADLRIGGLVRARGAGLGRLVDRLAGDAGGQRGDAADCELLARVAAVRLHEGTQLAGGDPAAEADLDEAGADAVAGHDADDAAFAAVLEGVVEAYGAASGRALEDRGKSGGLCRHVYNYTCAGVDTQEGSGK